MKIHLSRYIQKYMKSLKIHTNMNYLSKNIICFFNTTQEKALATKLSTGNYGTSQFPLNNIIIVVIGKH